MIWLTVAGDAVPVRLPAGGPAAPGVVLRDERRAPCQCGFCPCSSSARPSSCRSRSAMYLAWIMDGRYRAPRWLALDRTASGHRAAELEAVRRGAAAVQHGDVRLRLRRAGAAAGCCRSTPTTRRCWPRRRSSTPSLVPDQHEPAALLPASSICRTSASSSFIVWNMFVSAGVGFCALAAIIRGLRGDAHMGNFYVDMWRVVVYVFLPVQPDHGRAAAWRRACR